MIVSQLDFSKTLNSSKRFEELELKGFTRREKELKEIYEYYSFLYCRKENYTKAIEYSKLALKFDNKDPEILFKIAK
mgnify:CR=1 FL=1